MISSKDAKIDNGLLKFRKINLEAKKMSITISQITMHEGKLQASDKEVLSKRFSKDTKTLKRIRSNFDAAATKHVLGKNVHLDASLCGLLNQRYPELVSADPIADCKLLKRFKRTKNRYPFHRPYPPLRIGVTQDLPTNSGAIEAIGAMVSGIALKWLGHPICRCVGQYPDFIYRGFDGSYNMLESKATTNANLDVEIDKFMQEGLTEIVAGVCHNAALVTTVIDDLDPLIVSSHVTLIKVSSSSATKRKVLKDTIFTEVEEAVVDELAEDSSKSPSEVMTDVLMGDVQLAEELSAEKGDKIKSSVEKRQRELLQSEEEFSAKSLVNVSENDGSTLTVEEYHPACPFGDDPVEHCTVSVDDRRYFAEGKNLIEF